MNAKQATAMGKADAAAARKSLSGSALEAWATEQLARAEAAVARGARVDATRYLTASIEATGAAQKAPGCGHGAAGETCSECSYGAPPACNCGEPGCLVCLVESLTG